MQHFVMDDEGDVVAGTVFLSRAALILIEDHRTKR
jgi:hypothetical protein